MRVRVRRVIAERGVEADLNGRARVRVRVRVRVRRVIAERGMEADLHA